MWSPRARVIAGCRRAQSIFFAGAVVFCGAAIAEGLIAGDQALGGLIVLTALASNVGIAAMGMALLSGHRAAPKDGWASGFTRASWLAVVAGAMFVAALLMESNLAGEAWFFFFFFMFVAACLYVVLPLWVLEAGAWALLRSRRKQGVPARLSMTVVLVGTAAVTVLTGQSGSTTYLLSRPAMDAYLASRQGDVVTTSSVAVMPEVDHPSRIGLLPVVSLNLYPGGLRFSVPGAGGFMNRGGYAYSATGKPPGSGRGTYVKLSGNWWRWVEYF